jgi:hypothetical protein
VADASRDIGQPHPFEAPKQLVFRRIQCMPEKSVHGRFNRTSWIVIRRTYRKSSSVGNRSVDVSHSKVGESTAEHPTSARSGDRFHIARFPQRRHSPANQRGLRMQHLRDRFGRGRAAAQVHMNKHVKKPGQPSVALHIEEINYP